MSSMIQLDFGQKNNEILAKAKEDFDKYKSLVVGSGAKQYTDAILDDVATKTKAEIDMLIQTVEEQLQGLAEKGINDIYNAIGLDKSVIDFARTMIKTAEHASNLASSSILKGIMMMNKLDVNSLPMSAGVFAQQIMMTFATAFYKAFIEAYMVYVDMVINFVMDPGSALEVLKDMLDEAIKRIEELIDMQLQQYLGISLAQVKYYCRKGYGLYKQYKARKKKERNAKKDGEVSDNEGINKTKSKTSYSVDIEFDSEVYKQQLNAWLLKQRDSLYNAFLILQIKDMINDIKAVVKCMTDISIESLAENINNLDDMINMLDELGLGDDSTAIDLSLIPSLGLNDIYATLNSLADTDTLINEGKIMAVDNAHMLANSTSVSIDKTKTTKYSISTDAKNKVITVNLFVDPTKRSVSKDLYKLFSKAKAADGTALFNASECKIVQDNINELYAQTHKGTREVKLISYTVKIDIDIDDASENKNNDKEIVEPEPQEQQDIELTIMQDEVMTAAQMEKSKKETRRNTIALLHTAFSVVKALFPPLKEMAKLIQNYKENKAYVRSKHNDNLITLFMDALNKLGFNKKAKRGGSSSNGSGSGGTSTMYTVRTYELYQFIKSEGIVRGGAATEEINIQEVNAINDWLDKNDPTVERIDSSASTVVLYIDYDGIEEYLKCVREQTQALKGLVSDEELARALVDCKSGHRNGTFEGLSNVEVVDDEIMYSDLKLPRYPSQILTFFSKGYDFSK